MLVLTRRISESVIIGDETSITVLAIKGCQVRFGITAPKEVTVHREEVYQRIQHERSRSENAEQIYNNASELSESMDH